MTDLKTLHVATNRYPPKPKIPILPAYIARALKTNAEAWAFFRELSPRA